MSANLQAVDPQQMLSQWLAPNLKAFEQLLGSYRRPEGTE
jgi:hypothetical protein